MEKLRYCISQHGIPRPLSHPLFHVDTAVDNTTAYQGTLFLRPFGAPVAECHEWEFFLFISQLRRLGGDPRSVSCIRQEPSHSIILWQKAAKQEKVYVHEIVRSQNCSLSLFHDWHWAIHECRAKYVWTSQQVLLPNTVMLGIVSSTGFMGRHIHTITLYHCYSSCIISMTSGKNSLTFMKQVSLLPLPWQTERY